MDIRPFLQNKWLLVLAAIGIVCLLAGSFFNTSTFQRAATASTVNSNSTATGDGATADTSDSTLAFEVQYSKRVEDMLSQISGVNSVSVMVKMDTSSSVKLATNTKETHQTTTGNQGSPSNSTTVDQSIFTERTQDGSSVPYVVESTAPTVRGVLVVVDATDFFVAKSEIIDAIKNLLDVPAYKITVEPKKS